MLRSNCFFVCSILAIIVTAGCTTEAERAEEAARLAEENRLLENSELRLEQEMLDAIERNLVSGFPDRPVAEADASDSTAANSTDIPTATNVDAPPVSADNPSSAVIDSATLDAIGRPLTYIPPPLTPTEVSDGWISLFDGVSLLGWEPTPASEWRVESGAIVSDSGEPGFLMTPFAFRDFEFRCQFKLEAGGNSGVFLRTPFKPANPATDCYELNICDTHKEFKTGSFVGRAVAENVPAVEGEWHQFDVVCLGAAVSVSLDGMPIIELKDDSDTPLTSGRIGLQQNGGRIEFKDVSIRPLGARDLLSANSPEGWHEVPGGVSEFDFADGTVRVRNGPGFLESDETFDNFLLQVQAKPNAPGLNSGVFFRAIRGTAEAPSFGYEMQIHNGFEDGDRTKPVDSGTGAIFRRVAARYVVADDQQWLTATLIAQGDRFATWVDGYQVAVWIDDRPDDPNPRKGRRLEAGHLILQGHDKTTDVEFRNIRIVELPANPG